MRAITVAVEYSDLLSITLPRNRHHFSEVCVVTSTADEPNVRPITDAHGAKLVVTDLFYDRGADFNKWAALEFGLDQFGRHDWMVIMDADVVWPQKLPPFRMVPGFLYSPRRRIQPEITEPANEDVWPQLPLYPEGEFAGYSQIFHAGDGHLGQVPWHQTNWRHAGGADSAFQAKWPRRRKIRPPFEVLHIGPPARNWCGRSVPMRDGTEVPKSKERWQRMEDIFSRHRGGDYANERIM